MANYDEMEELLKSVKEYVDKLKTLAEVEESLNKYTGELDQLSSRCDSVLVRAGEYHELAARLDSKYSNISSSIDEVLRRHENVTQAFSIAEQGLRAIDSKQETFGEQLKNVQRLLDELEPKLTVDIQTALNEIGTDIDKRNTRTTVLLVILIILAVAAVALGITALVR